MGAWVQLGLPESGRAGGTAFSVLVLVPTRELAIQVSESFNTYGMFLDELKIATIYGGQSYDPQLRQLRRGAQVVVPAGALVGPDGQPVAGMVEVHLTPIDPSVAAQLAGAPGGAAGWRRGVPYTQTYVPDLKANIPLCPLFGSFSALVALLGPSFFWA